MDSHFIKSIIRTCCVCHFVLFEITQCDIAGERSDGNEGEGEGEGESDDRKKRND